jgi:hypothetical protein
VREEAGRGGGNLTTDGKETTPPKQHPHKKRAWGELKDLWVPHDLRYALNDS